jgi:hypothetical protein
MESLGDSNIKEVVSDIWLDAVDMEQELVYWMDQTKALEIEHEWREHDSASSGDDTGSILYGDGSL